MKRKIAKNRLRFQILSKNNIGCTKQYYIENFVAEYYI